MFEPIPTTTFSDRGACRSCGQTLWQQSLAHPARGVWAQIEHTVKQEGLPMVPPAKELAALMGWPLEQVNQGLETLKKRGIIKGLKGRPGEFRAVEANILERMNQYQRDALRASVQLHALLEEQRAIKYQAARNGDLAREIEALKERATKQNTLIRTLKDAKDALEAELKAARSEANPPDGAEVPAGV